MRRDAGRALVWLAAALALLWGCAPTVPSPAPEAKPAAQEESVRPGINERYLRDDLDVERWTRTFEGESREVAVHRDAIAAAVGLEPGMRVADVGAGTGLFMRPFAEAVGPGGTVYAVDISPGFLAHLRERAEREQLSQVAVVAGSERSTELPPGSVDRVFVCDTYHHFEYPRPVLESIRAALRPGGELVIVEFERIPGVTREWVVDHVRAGREVFAREIEAAGFGPAEPVAVPGLEENYVLRFRRP